ncbi:stress protein [Sphingobacterium siyangense]|jgi:tellurite resistance protein TerA|uniref:Stress protein n=1 Tax=Sphingobacterium puteale TaxID=2420510 RepID=A0A420VQC5_9SPHI|nr:MULTISPECIES: stress protein [Sphingobacterium]RKO68523.1 stress protein [Sphingobacterium puteale]
MAINLEKITLEKKGDSHFIDLSKKGNPITQEININLNWSKGTKKGIFGSLFSKDIDLDLGCFYELNNGEKTVIDGLQFSGGKGGTKDRLTRQGRYVAEPWIWHTGDDRGSSSGSGENIIVNPAGLKDLKRMVIYCFIYEGAARWQETNGVVTVKVPGNAEIEVQMGAQSSHSKFCAIAEILFSQNSITVRKLVTFHNSHGDCDKAYRWGMQWTAGSK